jgi:murein DD-endopeptidase MepM/ murein hydrolase activator NlpD
MRFGSTSNAGALSLLLCLAMIGQPVGAKTSRITSLRQERQQALQKRRQIETKLRQVKQQQRAARWDFSRSEQRLAAAEQELRSARTRLSANERHLRDTKARLQTIQHDLNQQTELLWRRLEVFYKEGSVGYLEVALGATDFDQFVDRAKFLRTIAEDDLRLKQKIEDNRAEQEALREDLERSWRELDSLRRQCDEKATEVRVATTRKHAFLASVAHDRRLQEQEYREIVETQRKLERILYSLQNPVGSGGSLGPLRGGFIRPVAGRIGSGFGWRMHPILHRRMFHSGVDIGAGHGTTIRAAAAGRVVHASALGGYGNCVMVQHGSGYVTLYGHCSSLLVGVGRTVSQGQPIARVGSTGRSTGPHLHFEVRQNGRAINPLAVR